MSLRNPHRLALLLVCLLLAGPAAAFPPGTQVQRDIAYGEGPAQRMDVYLPDVIEGAPVVVMVHGGAWVTGDKNERAVVANKARRMLAMGTIFVSVNYRLMPRASPLEQARDVARALALVQEKAVGWGGDPHDIVLMGHSSGGHLVALLSAEPGIARAEGAARWRGTIVLDGGGYDIEAIMRAGPPGIYARAFGTDRALWRAASPMARLGDDPVPMVLVCSTLSRWSCPGAKSFASRIGRHGGRARVVPVELRHMAINDALGLDEAYTAAVDDALREIAPEGG